MAVIPLERYPRAIEDRSWYVPGVVRHDGPRFCQPQTAHADAIRQCRLIRLVMMPVYDQLRATVLRQRIEIREAVPMRRRRFMRYKNVEAVFAQAVEIFGKDRVTVPERQAAAPVVGRLQGGEEFAARVELRRLALDRMPDPRLEYPGQAGNAQPGDLDGAAADIAFRICAHEIVERACGVRVTIAKYPVHKPAGCDGRRQELGQRRVAFTVAEQDQRARRRRRAGAEDRRKIAVRIAGKQQRTAAHGAEV